MEPGSYRSRLRPDVIHTPRISERRTLRRFTLALQFLRRPLYLFQGAVPVLRRSLAVAWRRVGPSARNPRDQGDADGDQASADTDQALPAAIRLPLTAIRLSLTTIRLSLTAIRPTLTTIRLSLTTIRLSLTAIRPMLTAIRPTLTTFRAPLPRSGRP